MSVKIPPTSIGDETPKICIIGAGFSGICSGIKLKEELGMSSFTIFESNKDIGGTWLTSTYPGCACDIPSHLYSLSFERNPDWSEHFPSQPEIWRYLKKVVDKHDLYPKIKFETQVKSLKWNEEKMTWSVVTLDLNSNIQETQEFDIIITCVGTLRLPNYPDEFNPFKGPLIHSAEWDSNVDLKDKVVGIVGSGASAIQIIPEIVDVVKELHVYQRKPAWVMPRPQMKFPDWIKTLFYYIPLLTWLFRAAIFIRNEINHKFIFRKDSWVGQFGLGPKLAKRHMKVQIPNDDRLRQDLTPNYAIGCKRIAPSSDYFPALTKPNVTLHIQRISEVRGHGIVTQDGNMQNLDVLLLATGYRVHDYFSPLEIIGRNSENILESFKKMPQTYYGIVSNSMPNLFIILGPNARLGHNSAVFMLECQVNFTMNAISEMMKRKTRMIMVKKQVQNDFMTWVMKELKNTVWGTEKCGSWYANKDGIVTTLWPESCTSYWKKTRNINSEDFEFRTG